MIYRVDFWIGLVSGIVWMYAMWSIWGVLWGQSPGAFNVQGAQMQTYGVLGVLLMPFLGTGGAIQAYIAQQVRQGTLEMDLMKPLDFIWQMFCRNMGDACVGIVTRTLPAFLFGYLFLGFRLPASGETILLFVVSLLLGYYVNFTINLMMGMLAIATLDIRSYAWAFFAIVRFASGAIVPLFMFPEPLRSVFLALPFKDIYYTPMAIYISAPDLDIARMLLSQAGWGLALTLVARLVWIRLQRRVTVQGG
jgi:ABC-2 type transport system permease protein